MSFPNLKNFQGISLFSFLIVVVILAALYKGSVASYQKVIQIAKKEICHNVGGAWNSSGKKCSFENILKPLNDRITDNPELSKIKITIDDIKKSIRDFGRQDIQQPQRDRFSSQSLSIIPAPTKEDESPEETKSGYRPLPGSESPSTLTTQTQSTEDTTEQARPPNPSDSSDRTQSRPLADATELLNSPSSSPKKDKKKGKEQKDSENCPLNYKLSRCKKIVWGTPCPNTVAGASRKQWYYAVQEKIWGGKAWCYQCTPEVIKLSKKFLGSNCATLEELKKDKKNHPGYTNFIKNYRTQIINTSRPTELHEP